MKKDKSMINLVIIGDVDHGKSTLAGRILYELKSIPKEEIDRAEKHAKAFGEESAKFAYLLDKTLQERIRGGSIELSFVGFETKNKKINMIDAPGHQEFMRNLITGVAAADAAVLVIDATDSESNLMSSQMKEHITIAYVFGIEQMAVLINKMDKVNYEKDRFEKVKEKIISLLKKVGYKNEKFEFIPISALFGDNILTKSKKMEWYKGKTLIEVLDSFKEPKRIIEGPFRMPIIRTFNLPDVGIVIAGKIESGKIKVGDRIIINPSFGKELISAEVASIEWQHKRVKEASHGMDVGLALTKLSRSFTKRQIKKGYIVTDPENKLQLINAFKAEVVILDHPSGIKEGYRPILYCHQARIPCEITKIEAKIDQKNRQIVEKNPKIIKKEEVAILILKPLKPFVAELERKVPRLGRFVLRDSNITVAAGKIIEIL